MLINSIVKKSDVIPNSINAWISTDITFDYFSFNITFFIWTKRLNIKKPNIGIAEYVMPHVLKERTVYAEVDVESANPRTIFDLNGSHIAKEEAEAVCEYVFGQVFDSGE